LQPDAVTAIMGDDVRWVGNEKGLGRETEWSATALLPDSHKSDQNSRLGLRANAGDLGGRGILENAGKVVWWPSEVDVSIRPGWFYHDSEQPKSLRKLAEIYLESVGRNSVLLLNVPPDRRGLIAASDSARLAEFGRWLDANFPEEKGGQPIDLPYPKQVNCAVVEEDISKGQRIEAFTVEGLVAGEWKPLASGTTVGLKRMLLFEPVTVDSLRLNVTAARRTPEIAGFRGLMVDLPADLDAAAASLALPKGVTQAVDGATCTLRFDTPAELKGFVYIPEGDRPAVFNYTAEVSRDGGRAWTPVNGLSGEFSNIQNNPIPQTVAFPAPHSGVNAFRLRAATLTDGSAPAFTGKVVPVL
nr:alpha-L-fucosidase [Muribaculaceae bacterium]